MCVPPPRSSLILSNRSNLSLTSRQFTAQKHTGINLRTQLHNHFVVHDPNKYFVANPYVAVTNNSYYGLLLFAQNHVLIFSHAYACVRAHTFRKNPTATYNGIVVWRRSGRGQHPPYNTPQSRLCAFETSVKLTQRDAENVRTFLNTMTRSKSHSEEASRVH